MVAKKINKYEKIAKDLFLDASTETVNGTIRAKVPMVEKKLVDIDCYGHEKYEPRKKIRIFYGITIKEVIRNIVIYLEEIKFEEVKE